MCAQLACRQVQKLSESILNPFLITAKKVAGFKSFVRGLEVCSCIIGYVRDCIGNYYRGHYWGVLGV